VDGPGASDDRSVLLIGDAEHSWRYEEGGEFIRKAAREEGMDSLSMPIRLKSGDVVATGRKRSTDQVFLLIDSGRRIRPVRMVPFTSDEWEELVRGSAEVSPGTPA